MAILEVPVESAMFYRYPCPDTCERDIKIVDDLIMKDKESLEAILEHLEEIPEESTKDVVGIAAIVFNSHYVYTNSKHISKEDIRILSDWFDSERHVEYAYGFYRVDISSGIFLFQIRKRPKRTILIGHILKKDINVRYHLLTLRHDYLMRSLDA